MTHEFVLRCCVHNGFWEAILIISPYWSSTAAISTLGRTGITFPAHEAPLCKGLLWSGLLKHCGYQQDSFSKRFNDNAYESTRMSRVGITATPIYTVRVYTTQHMVTSYHKNTVSFHRNESLCIPSWYFCPYRVIRKFEMNKNQITAQII